MAVLTRATSAGTPPTGSPGRTSPPRWRTHKSVANSDLVLIEGGPHGLNLTHADEVNAALLGFVARL